MQRTIVPDISLWSRWQADRGVFFNSYLVAGADGAFAVDPLETDDPSVMAALEAAGVKTIVVTNRDHERASASFAAALGARVIASEPDAASLVRTPDAVVRDGEEILGWRVIVLDGYKTPGEMVLLDERRGIAISGDAFWGDPAGALRLMPDEKLADPVRALRSARRLRERNLTHLFVGDGAPAIGNADALLGAMLAARRERGTIKTIATRALDCAYIERGPADGDAVLLVHGFPDDASTWDAIAPELAADGWRTIAPYVRGFGPTRLRPDAERSGETAAITRDILDLADALGIDRFHVVGHDWGARAAYSLAALAPDRVRSITALANGYATNVAGAAMDAEQLRAYWYQWYFATPRGERALAQSRTAFCRDLWRLWSPSWAFDDADYARTAASFENPDFVEIVLHSYRSRWGFAPFAESYAADRAAIDAHPAIAIPTAVLMGERDGATLPSSTAGRETYFRAAYGVRVLADCGHFIPRERPGEVLATVRALIGAARGGDAAASR